MGTAAAWLNPNNSLLVAAESGAGKKKNPSSVIAGEKQACVQQEAARLY